MEFNIFSTFTNDRGRPCDQCRFPHKPELKFVAPHIYKDDMAESYKEYFGFNMYEPFK